MQPIAAIAVLILVWAAAAGSSFGAEVTFTISGRQTYVGVPVSIQVVVKNAKDHDPPVIPEVDGADVRVDQAGTQTFTSIINGRVERSTSITYNCIITPRRAGTIEIPSIRVKADGKWTQSGSTTIVVKKSENDGLLYLEIVGDVDSVYVGEPIDVTLEIWLKPFTGRTFGLDEQTMWRSCVDARNSSWGPFAEVIQGRQVRVRTDQRLDDQGGSQTYYVYWLRHRVWPERPGVFDASGVSVLVQYPLSVRRNRFSIFASKYSITESRPISAVVEDVAIEVKAPLQEGQPAIYRGAVGRYSMTVKATPTQVSVGDPITININLEGTGRLELLQPPPLTLQPLLTADFRVPDEELAGVVENGVKKFSQSIRAQRDDVTQIPPIAFAYFDPRSEKYVTIRSDPIPIKVKASTRLAVSQVVEGQVRPGIRTELTLLDSGLWANYDDISELLAEQSVLPGLGVWGFTVAMPVIYCVCFMFSRYRDRLRGDQNLGRRRWARRRAMSAIKRQAGLEASLAASEVTNAVMHYVADRYNLPPGGVTRADAVAQLRAHQVPPEIIIRVDALLSECESAQYAGGSPAFDPSGQGRGSKAAGLSRDADDLAGRAMRCINELERQKV